MVEQQTRVRESTAQDELRLQRMRSRHHNLLAAAVGLLLLGTAMVVTSFVVLIRDRNETSGRTTPARAIADSISQAGYGCEDFNGFRPIGTGILNDAQCNTDFGGLRIVVYRTPKALVYARGLTRSFTCSRRAAAGQTSVISIIKGNAELTLGTPDVAGARKLHEVVGGKIETVDCTAPPATTATTAPTAPAVPAEPPPEAPPG